MISKETVLLLIAFIWGVYSIVVGLSSIINGYSNDLVWISIITAIAGTTSAHVAISLSPEGLSMQASGPVQNTESPKQG